LEGLYENIGAILLPEKFITGKRIVKLIQFSLCSEFKTNKL